MQFDFKITTWERVAVPQQHEQEVLEAIKSGLINSSQDVFDFLDSKGYTEEPYCEIIPEVEEQMYPEENGGCATIEVRDGKDWLFENGTNGVA